MTAMSVTKSAVLALAAALALTLAGCGNNSESSGTPTTNGSAAANKQISVYLLPKQKGIPYFETCSQGAFEAAKELGVVAEVEPTAMVYYELGRAVARVGRVDEAILHYQRALALNPNACEVHNNLGSALARMGRFDDSIEHYKESLRLCPDHERVRENLAKVEEMAKP